MTRWIIERSDGMFYTPHFAFSEDLEYAKFFKFRSLAMRIARMVSEGEKVEIKKVKVTVEF